MYVNLYFTKLASRAGVKGAIFTPGLEDAGVQNDSQFLSFEFLSYMLTHQNYDAAKEEKLMRLDENYILPAGEIHEAFERHDSRTYKDKRLSYIGLTPHEGEIMGIFRTADKQDKIILSEGDIRILLENPEAAMNEKGFSISERQLCVAIGHFKNTALIANAPESP